MGYHEDFINKISVYVTGWRDICKWGCASAIIAQACLESAYGRSNKAVNYNNYFGLKMKPGRVTCNDGYFTDTSSEQLPDGTYITITTQWYSFPDMNNGVLGYYQFISSGGYKGIELCTTPESYLQKLKDCGYATSQNYVNNCMAIVNKYNLTKYDGVSPMPELKPDSPLASKLISSPTTYGKRPKTPDLLIIHHMGCYPSPTAEEQCKRFANKSRRASATYCIGNKGDICQGLLEAYAPCTSSSKKYDMRAITIEVANSSGAPNWFVSAEAVASLIALVTDICKRNNIKMLIWASSKYDRLNGTNGVNMVMHKDLAKTACPGPFMEGCLPYVALAVDQNLGVL